MKRPEKKEYAEFYSNYVDLVERDDILSEMQKQLEETSSIFSQIAEEKGTYAYQEGKWSIKELLGHLIDGERVFSYRAFRFSRADKTPLAGFDQNPYIKNANYNSVKLADLLEEFVLLRKSNIHFLKNLSETAWDNVGIASENPITVRALAFIMVGHIEHHVKILKERYLTAVNS